MTRTRIHATVVAAALLFSVTGATTAAPPPVSFMPAVAEAGSVTGLSVVPGTGRAEVVINVQGDYDLMDFALPGNRVVVDIKGAKLGIAPRQYDKVQRAGIANVRFSQFSAEVVRIVLDLDTKREYTVVRGDNAVRVTVEGPSEFEPWSTLAQGQGRPPVNPVPTVTNVAVTGEAPREPSAANPPALNASSNPKIETMSASSSPQQRGSQSRISIAFHDADIRDVVVAFADHAGKTIVVGPAVTGTVRATIVDKPWDVALKSILDGYGLAAVEDSSGIIRVDSYANLRNLAAVEPMFTSIIQVNYTRAETMAATVRSLLGAGCAGAASAGAPAPAAGADPAAGAAAAPAAPSGGMAVSCNSRGSVTHDEKTNSVMITETASRIAEIESYIRQLDVRTPQITIKAKIITVDRTGTEALGLAYDLGTAGTFSNAIITRAGTVGDNRVNLSGDGFAGVANSQRNFKGTATLGLIHNMVLGGFNLTTFLDALSSVQLTDVQAEPSTTTVDNKEANLFSGSSISYLLTPPVPAGQITSVAPQIARQDIGIQLKVTPHVTANRQILLDVFAEQQVLQTVTAAGPNTSKRNTTNQVLVGDGETAVIGGLTQTQVRRNRSGIPLLMDLPGIGRLFSQTEVVETKQDLLILITPIIVDEGQVVRPPTRRP